MLVKLCIMDFDQASWATNRRNQLCSSMHQLLGKLHVPLRMFEAEMSGVAFLGLRLQSCSKITESYSGLRQKSKLQLLFSLLLLEEFLQTLQSQCYPNFGPMLNFMLVRLLVFRDCARTDASQRA